MLSGSSGADVLIFGKNGQVGHELLQSAPVNVVVAGAGSADVDLTQTQSIRDSIADHSPKLIINAAAYTAVDRAETEQELAFSINALAPKIMAEECARRKIPLIHYSTDYIYPGDKRAPYIETDVAGPINVYGRSKLAGDDAIAESAPEHLILRTCWVYGARRQNFLLTMLRLGQERESVQVVDDQTGCPTSARFIAEATWAVAQKMLASSPSERERLSGAYHLACSSSTTWFGFAEKVFMQAELRKMPLKLRCLAPIRSGEYPTPAKRPGYSVLDCGKLERTFDIHCPEWSAELARIMDSLLPRTGKMDYTE